MGFGSLFHRYGILLCGVLTCREYFRTPNQRSGATMIFNRVDWTWLSEDTTLLPHGWTPESGFLPLSLGLLQRTDDDVPAGAGLFELSPAGRIRGRLEANRPSNTTASATLDRLRRSSCISIRRPGLIFAASATSTRTTFRTRSSPRKCTAASVWTWRKQFPDYSDDLWGITASDSQHGYVVWGGPPATGPIDGTVVPCAAGGSLPFLPQATMRVLRTIKDRYAARLEPLRIRGCVQSADELVRQRRDRHRHWNHDGDGGKRAHRFRLENVHEESGSAARHAARGISNILTVSCSYFPPTCCLELESEFRHGNAA